MSTSSIPSFVGLDYHQDSVQVCILDHKGKVLVNRSVANDARGIAALCTLNGPPERVAVEACSTDTALGEGLRTSPALGAGLPTAPSMKKLQDSCEMQRLIAKHQLFSCNCMRARLESRRLFLIHGSLENHLLDYWGR